MGLLTCSHRKHFLQSKVFFSPRCFSREYFTYTASATNIANAANIVLLMLLMLLLHAEHISTTALRYNWVAFPNKTVPCEYILYIGWCIRWHLSSKCHSNSFTMIAFLLSPSFELARCTPLLQQLCSCAALQWAPLVFIQHCQSHLLPPHP